MLVSSTSTSGSNRRVPPPRGSPFRSPLSGIPFVRLMAVRFFPCEAFPHAEGRLRIHAFCGSAFPFFWSYVFFPALVYARAVPLRGRAGRVFPAATAYEYIVFSEQAFCVVSFFFADPLTRRGSVLCLFLSLFLQEVLRCVVVSSPFGEKM